MKISKHKSRISRPRYTSKAYRNYCAYIIKRFGGLSWLFAYMIYRTANRPGFIRKFMAITSGNEIPAYSDSAKYLAFKSESRVYDRRMLYAIPEFILYDDEFPESK